MKTLALHCDNTRVISDLLQINTGVYFTHDGCTRLAFLGSNPFTEQKQLITRMGAFRECKPPPMPDAVSG